MLHLSSITILPHKQKNALQTVGYKEIFGFIDQEYDWERMVDLLKQNSRRYAKRQLTWFRKDTEIQWFHPSDWAGILSEIEEKLAD